MKYMYMYEEEKKNGGEHPAIMSAADHVLKEDVVSANPDDLWADTEVVPDVMLVS